MNRALCIFVIDQVSGFSLLRAVPQFYWDDRRARMEQRDHDGLRIELPLLQGSMVMKSCSVLLSLLAVLSVLTAGPVAAQGLVDTPPSTAPTAPTVIPIVIPVSGQLTTAPGVPRTGAVRLTLALYAAQGDPTPIWIEQQIVALSVTGYYAVNFGSTQIDGLPADFFAAGAARWLGVTVEDEPEQPRVMLVSVPYAAKAAAADTLGGRAATDFVLAETLRESVEAAFQTTNTAETTELIGAALEGGSFMSSSTTTLNTIAKFIDSSGTVGDSTMNDTGGYVGVGLANPTARLELGGMFSRAAGETYFLRTSGTINANVNERAAFARFSGTLVEAASGVHDIMAGVAIHAPTITAGVAGLEDAATLYVSGATAGTVSGGNYAFWVDNGNARFDGNVGIGTTAPAARLDVAGTGRFTGDLTAENVTASGTMSVTGAATFANNVTVTGNVTATGNLAAKYQDVAEWVDAAEPLAAATVVAADPTGNNRVRRSTRAYDTAVLGVVSAQPGLLLGEAGDGKVAVAQSGRVKVKVDGRYGAIKPGDLLVASPIAGVAMRSRPTPAGVHRPGTIIGKALEALPKGKGEILVLLTLQ